MLVFSDLNDLGQINETRIDLHLKAQESKKRQVYKEMTDRQIDEVLATMMSVSRFSRHARNSSFAR